MFQKKDLYNNIINSDIKTKQKLLKDKKIRKQLLKEGNFNTFTSIIKSLTYDDVDYLLDNDLIDLIINNNERTYLIIDVMLENKCCSKFLTKDKILSYVVENFDNFECLDINFANALLSLIVKNNNYVTCLSNLNSNIQYELLSNRDNLNTLINQNIKTNFLYLLDSKVIEMLLNEPYFSNMFLNTDIDIINEYYIKKDIKIPNHLYNNKLISKYLEINDVNKYRNYIENISNIYFKNEVESLRKKKYINIFNNINNGLLPNYNTLYNKIINNLDYTDIIKENSFYLKEIDKFKNKDDILKYLQQLSIKESLEITIDMYFNDITYNFLKNVYSILNYLSLVEENLIDKENLNIYNKLINYYNLSNEERIELFNSLNNGKDYTSIFYDDFRRIRNHSYNQIKSNLIDFNKLKQSNKYESRVYELEGEKFYALINHTLFKRNKPIDRDWNPKQKTLSFTLISNDNLTTFRNKEENIILGFDPDIDNIVHLYESDSFSEGLNSSNRVQRLFTSEELVKRTKGYNEILIKNKDYDDNNILFPSYIVCFDEIKIGDLEFSKKYDLPIVLINSSKYSSKKETIDLAGDSYIDNYSSSFLNIDTYKKIK